MKRSLPLQIALTHLLSKPKQTVVAMLGVTFGISMFILMISFMTGVNKFTEQTAMDQSPDIRIYNPISSGTERIAEKYSTNPDTGAMYVVYHQRPKNVLPKLRNGLQIADRIAAMPGVLGVAPTVSSQAFFNNGPVQISGVITGVDVKKQIALFKLDERMEEGNLQDLLRLNDALIMGKGLAAKLNVKVGDHVSITTPAGANLMLRVVGIFSFGMAQFDDSKSYATLATVQKVMQRDPSFITELSVKLVDFSLADRFAVVIHERFDIYAEDWKSANQGLLAGEKIRNFMTGLISFTLLMVAGFGIYNIMNMTIMNKIKDIAILKATGFQGSDVVGIFLWQSAIIGALGGLMGLAIGFTSCFFLSKMPFPAGEFLRIRTMPVTFEIKYYVMGLAFGVLTTLFAGYFPAKKAAKIDPVSILRG